MNNDRRKEISKALSIAEELKSTLENLRDEEQEYYDNMPESLQGSDKGEAASEAVTNLENAISSMDEVVDHLGSDF